MYAYGFIILSKKQFNIFTSELRQDTHPIFEIFNCKKAFIYKGITVLKTISSHTCYICGKTESQYPIIDNAVGDMLEYLCEYHYRAELIFEKFDGR